MSRWIAGAALVALVAVATYVLLRGARPDRAEVEAIVEAYLLEHPEIIPEAMNRLEARRAGERVAAVRDELETPFAGAWAGAEDGDVTVVEFFDYACGYCRESVADLQRLVAEDENVRVVFRELPILSPESEAAARTSLAAAKQGDFFAFHRALFEAGRPGEATIASASRAAGLDAAQAARDAPAADITAELQNNLALARRLQISGTPAFIVGDQLLSGAVGYERLKEAVAEARAAG